MSFTITGRHMEITPAIRAHAEEKTSKLPKFYSSINQVDVVLDGSGAGGISVEVIARGEHGNVFVVSESGGDAYSSIDAAVHKMERQLRRKKEKERDNKHISSS